MKILNGIIVCCVVGCISLTAQAEKVDSYPVQFTVWNMTNQPIQLKCHPNQGVTMDQEEYTIVPNDSPAIFLTADRYGNLVGCNIEGTAAAFEYTIFDQNKENVEITHLPADEPNFYYNSSYPGALTYH